MVYMKAKRLSDDAIPTEIGEYTIVLCDGKPNPVIILPCGDRFMPQNKWDMTDIEDETKITLSPSIFCHHENRPGSGNSWHGFLQNGEFVTV